MNLEFIFKGATDKTVYNLKIAKVMYKLGALSLAAAAAVADDGFYKARCYIGIWYGNPDPFHRFIFLQKFDITNQRNGLNGLQYRSERLPADEQYSVGLVLTKEMDKCM